MTHVSLSRDLSVMLTLNHMERQIKKTFKKGAITFMDLHLSECPIFESQECMINETIEEIYDNNKNSKNSQIYTWSTLPEGIKP